MKEYLYDPHTHTAETSKCGHLPAAEVVDRYAGHGFSGLVVTDHLHPEYLSRIDTDHNWDHVIDHYLAGYRASKARGDELGLDVILGAELRFPENDNDYLRLAGSDTHEDGDECRAGVLLPERVRDSFAYRRMIEGRCFRLWSPVFPELAADEALRRAEPAE